MTSFGGNLRQCDKNKLDKIIKKAGSVIGKKLDSLDRLVEERRFKKMQRILRDDTHPLNEELYLHKIERSGRFRIPKARTNRYLNSFIPSSIRIFNERMGRSV